MTLELKELRKIPHLEERKYVKVQKGSGLFLVVENSKNNCKRFEGLMRYPKGSKNNTRVYFPHKLKEMKKEIDISNLLTLWDEIKKWSKSTGKNPNDYFKKDEVIKSSLTLGKLFENYLEYYEQIVSPRTFKDRKNKFRQILNYFGEDTSVTDFEWDRGGRSKVLQLIKSMKSRGIHNHPIRIRSLLKQCFDWGIGEGIFPREQNPCSIPFDIEKVGLEPKNNPSINWSEVPELFEKINSSTNSVITKSSTKLYLMTCIRVSVIVSMKWDWIDEEREMIIVPPDTEGLKRTLSRKNNPEYEHYIPLTDEIKTILNRMRRISGDKEYVFWTPRCGQYPHQNPSSINIFLKRLGYNKKLTGQGWRRVVVTEGQQVCGTERDIIERQIGHTGYRSGSIGSYDNTQFLPERKLFLEKWCKELVKQGLKI